MKLSEITKSCNQFTKPTFTITLNGKLLYPGEMVLKSLHIDLTYEHKTNYAEVTFIDIEDDKTLDKCLHNGACIIIKGGYQLHEQIIFQGYLHTITFQQKNGVHLHQLTLYAQDVKGLMMLHKQSGILKGKTKSSIIQDIINTSVYKNYVSAVTFTALSKTLNTPYYIDGSSDYEILCLLCSQLFYAFYVDQDKLFLKPRYQSSDKLLELDNMQHIYEITTRFTIQDYIGNITVQTCDGFEKKKRVQEKVIMTSYPYASSLSELQKHSHTIMVDDGFHDMEELQYISRMMKQEIEYGYAHMDGQCVFLPDLSCAMRMQYKDSNDAIRKGFVTHVIHHMDGDDLYSEWESDMQKG